MKDIPMFETEYGVASIVLREIPYLQKAYVTLQATQQPRELVEECLRFCRMCGAEEVFFKGHHYLEQFPLYTEMWYMQACRAALPETDAALWPAMPENVEQWQKIYNEKVRKVPNGAWMTNQDAQQMLKKGDGYFIHRDGKLLGIGRASGDIIDWVAAVEPGAGVQVLCALAHVISGDTVRLLVASANEKGLALYQKMGFVPTSVLSRWYRISPENLF